MSTASHYAEVRAKFFPPTRPIVKAPAYMLQPKPRPVVRRLLADGEPVPALERAARIKRVVSMACMMYSTTAVEVAGLRKSHILVLARLYIAVRLARELGLSTTRIGEVIGRDHSSVCNLLRRAEGVPLMRRNGQIKRRKKDVQGLDVCRAIAK